MGELSHIPVPSLRCAQSLTRTLQVRCSRLPGWLSSGDHHAYNPSKSSTYQKADGQAWKIGYGDGSSASGDVGTDIVNIGGLIIKHQAIEMAKEMSKQFSAGTCDGLLGLGFKSINTITTDGTPDPQPTPVDNMISQADIPKEAELFTSCFYCERDDVPSESADKSCDKPADKSCDKSAK